MNVHLSRTFVINGVTADLGSETLRDTSGAPIDLRPQTFAVLRYLAEHAGRLVTKAELMKAVWPGIAVTDDSLVQCIHEIRRAFHDDDHAVLKTVPKRGYRLVIPSEVASPVSRPSLKWIRPAAIATAMLLAIGGSLGWWLLQHGVDVNLPRGAKPTVAVLPFKAVTGDEASSRLATGLTEDIITDLARFPEFQVIARNSTEVYKHQPVSPVEIGKALHVGFVVDGSIQREAERVRITAQLIDASSGRNLWSDRWDRPDQDLFAIQTEISEQLANRLGGGNGLIQEAGRLAAHRKPPDNLNAYELYLLGTEKLEQINVKDVQEAIKLLDRAVELDPGLARAWIELYHSHSVLAGFHVDHDTNRRLSVEAAERAVRLDPSDAEAHAVYAMSFGERGDFERAKGEFEVALRLGPNQFEILTFYIGWASTFGEPERGAGMVDQAIRLNPNFPMWAARPFAYAYYMVGRYEDTLLMMERLSTENYGPWMWAMRSGALASLGRMDEAKAAVEAALKMFPNLAIEGFTSDVGWSDAERERFKETMLLAGFPVCSKPGERAQISKAMRFAECER
jgi:TolB-like protein/DNA-binding winged helix-turn-helix (wHTH) protein